MVSTLWSRAKIRQNAEPFARDVEGIKSSLAPWAEEGFASDEVRELTERALGALTEAAELIREAGRRSSIDPAAIAPANTSRVPSHDPDELSWPCDRASRLRQALPWTMTPEEHRRRIGQALATVRRYG